MQYRFVEREKQSEEWIKPIQQIQYAPDSAKGRIAAKLLLIGDGIFDANGKILLVKAGQNPAAHQKVIFPDGLVKSNGTVGGYVD